MLFFFVNFFVGLYALFLSPIKIKILKICIECKQEKSISEFHKSLNRPDGCQLRCKSCISAYAKTRYIENKENIRTKSLVWKKTRRGRLLQAESKKRIRLKYPNMIKAQTAVANAVRLGKLIKQNCEICGDIKTEAHHDNYDMPLLVRWLCRKHHLEFHKIIKHE